MTDDDWTQIVRWLQAAGYRVVSIDREKDQVLIELPTKRECLWEGTL